MLRITSYHWYILTAYSKAVRRFACHVVNWPKLLLAIAADVAKTRGVISMLLQKHAMQYNVSFCGWCDCVMLLMHGCFQAGNQAGHQAGY